MWAHLTASEVKCLWDSSETERILFEGPLEGLHPSFIWPKL